MTGVASFQTTEKEVNWCVCEGFLVRLDEGTLASKQDV